MRPSITLRYRGEEFTIVFPGKLPAQAQLEVLRSTIENYRMLIPYLI